TNAYKFTEAGGITISWDKRAAGFYISVEDTGKGIADEDHAKVFERFHKDSSSSGKGLGLAIVRELAEVMGGKVELVSVQGKGSRFTLDF
ncbi:MAG: HAMP domain-containing histidine kinase, partial [Nitrospirota bacterium]|nr:HAMP domain-containing histidine kinase [Nitrospirota bacterium]